MNHAAPMLYLRAVLLVAIGAIVGAFIVSTMPIVLDFTGEQFDSWKPVIRDIRVSVQSVSDEDILIHMDGFKQRKGCIYVGLQASIKGASGVAERVYLRRVDKPETGDTRPEGPIDMGIWRIWPTSGADKVEVHGQHVCSGRLVTALFASISLKQDKPTP